MITTSATFKGHTYIKGNHPQKELNTTQPLSWEDQINIQLALKDNLKLIELNDKSKLDICITRDSATIEYLPKKDKSNEMPKPKEIKTFKKGFFKSMGKFYKEVLTYAIENRLELEKQTRPTVADLFGNRGNLN